MTGLSGATFLRSIEPNDWPYRGFAQAGSRRPLVGIIALGSPVTEAARKDYVAKDRPPPRPQRRPQLLNRFDRSSPMAGEAEVKYLDGDFRVVRPGAFVRCAVTGAPIPLEELKYWSVDLQEAYSSPEAVLQRHFPDQFKR
jgi:hypothetical protein